MPRTIFIVLFWLAASTSQAKGYGYFCANLADQVNRPEATSPALTITITENGKLRLYNVPSIYCVMKKVAVAKGDALAVYRSYDGWVNVRYVDKNGKDYMGWIQEFRMNEIADKVPIPDSR